MGDFLCRTGGNVVQTILLERKGFEDWKAAQILATGVALAFRLNLQ